MAAELALPPERPPALVNLIYISDCLIPADAPKPALAALAALAALLAHAETANRKRSVAGALLVAGNRFVQTLEGERAVVDRFRLHRVDGWQCSMAVAEVG